MSDASDGVKVVFELDREDDDWPPAASESVWATRVAPGQYQLDNVPWFVPGVSFGDIVRAAPADDGALVVSAIVAWSGRYTIRVIPFEEGPLQGSVPAVVELFAELGAECESALPAYAIVAVDIPPTARVTEIKRLLERGEREGWWGYEEGCIDDAWSAL